MQFRDFISPENILDDLSATTKSEALGELIDAVFAQGLVPKDLREAVLAALFRREELQSTAVGQGLAMAIPHAKHPGVRGLVGVFGRSREGIDFDSPDKQPVHLFFLLLSNRECADKHLQALAHISLKCRDIEFRNCLLKALDKAQIAEFLDDSDNED